MMATGAASGSERYIVFWRRYSLPAVRFPVRGLDLARNYFCFGVCRAIAISVYEIRKDLGFLSLSVRLRIANVEGKTRMYIEPYVETPVAADKSVAGRPPKDPAIVANASLHDQINDLVIGHRFLL
jgi:hypothetical protein